MKCGRCGFENRSGILYCTKCGAGIGSLCAECGSGVSPDDRYCGHCGFDLAILQDSSPKGEKKQKENLLSQPYLSNKTLTNISPGTKTYEPGIKQFTVMICELDENKTFLKNMDRDETYSMKEKILEILIRKINEYEGTVNQILEDKIISFFGGVIPIKNAPQRAVQSAWSIHRDILRFNGKLRKEPPVKIKIGIHHGLINMIRIDEQCKSR